ncbi:uncharacterized protein LOC118458074 isoform X2 [Anopheles albimanus]|nr:uncharacterized protein LOC118458074 isoform X2 [Anopheles albimanus]
MLPFSGSFMNFADSSQNTVSTCTNELIDRLIMDEAYRMISNAARPMQPVFFPYPPPNIDHIKQHSRVAQVSERTNTTPSNALSTEMSETHADDCIPTEKPVVTNTSVTELSLSTPSTVGERSRVLLERSAEQVTRKLIDQLATMNKSNLKEMINNPGTKYETALKNHARNKLRAEIRRQLKNINLTANSRPDEEVGNVRPDESIDADKIPDALLHQIGQVLDFEFFNQPDPETEDADNDHTPIVMDISVVVDEVESKSKSLSVSDNVSNWSKSSHDFVNLLSDSDVGMDIRDFSDTAPAIPPVDANLVSNHHENNNLVFSQVPESEALSSRMLPEVISTAKVVTYRSKSEMLIDATDSAHKVDQKLHNESISFLSDNQQKKKKDKDPICKQSQNECISIALKNDIPSLLTPHTNQTKSSQKLNNRNISNMNKEKRNFRKILPNPAKDEASLSHSMCSLKDDANIFTVTNIMSNKDNELRTKSPTVVPILGVSTKPVKPSIRSKNSSRGNQPVKPNLALRKRAASSNPKSSVSTISSSSHDSEFRTKSPTPVAISSLSTKEAHPEFNSSLRPWDRHNSRYPWSRHSGRRYKEAINSDPQRSTSASLLSTNDKRLDARVGDQYVSHGGFSLTYEHHSTDKPIRAKTRHPWIVKPGDIRAYHRNIVPTITGSDTDSISSDQSNTAVNESVTTISTRHQTSDSFTLNSSNCLHSYNPVDEVSGATNGTRKHSSSSSSKTGLPTVDPEPLVKEVKSLIKEKILNGRDKLQPNSFWSKTTNVHPSTESFLSKESNESRSRIVDIQEIHTVPRVENNREKRQNLSEQEQPLCRTMREEILPFENYRMTQEPESPPPETDHYLPNEHCTMKQESEITRNNYHSNDLSTNPFMSSNQTYQQPNDIDNLPSKELDASPAIINELSPIAVGDNDVETLSYDISIDDNKAPTEDSAPNKRFDENDNNMLAKEGIQRKGDSIVHKDSSLTQDSDETSQVQTELIENVRENTPQLRTVPLASLTVNESNIQENTHQIGNGSPMVCIHSWASKQDSHLIRAMVSSQRGINLPYPSRTTLTHHSKRSNEIDIESPYKMPQELSQSIASSLDGIESIDMETMMLLRRKMDIDTEIMKLDAERMSIDQQLVKKHNERNRQMNGLRMAFFSSIGGARCPSNGMCKKKVASKDDANLPLICKNSAERPIQLEENSSGLQDAYPAGSAHERTIRRITRLSENSELMRIFQRRRLLSERSSDDNPLTEDGVLIEQ